MRTFLKPGWIVDGTGAPAVADQAVVVVDGLIESVVPRISLKPEEGDRVVDLPGMTLLPGLTNNHCHLTLPGTDPNNAPFLALERTSDASLAVQAAHNLGVALSAGVTTMRDCGGRGTVVLDVRNAQAAGLVRGARVALSCGFPLTISGGHLRSCGGEADGIDGVRRMVRKVVSLGADFVKVMASGGGTPGTFSNLPSFSLAELKAIVEESHNLQRPVSAHCIATASIANAIEAEVDLMEHASFMEPDGQSRFDPRVAERLAESGIPVTPTFQASRDMSLELPPGPDRDQWAGRYDEGLGIMRQLREMGVRLLAGSDSGWRVTAFDTFARELESLVHCGLSAVVAVHAATGAVNRVFGRDKLYGTIEAGRVADLLVVHGDVASDIRCLRQVRSVYQGGELVHHRHQNVP